MLGNNRPKEMNILTDRHIDSMFGTKGSPRISENYIQDGTLQKLREDLYSLQTCLAEKEHKMEQLVSKLYVDIDGDIIQGSYKLRFSPFENERSEVQRSIIRSVVELYGLELQRERKKLDDFVSFIDAIFSEKDYCEVDLFGKEKGPVEC